ncbi:MAG: hypothetical protein AAGI46_04090 [Planctomycetota bacterium]
MPTPELPPIPADCRKAVDVARSRSLSLLDRQAESGGFPDSDDSPHCDGRAAAYHIGLLGAVRCWADVLDVDTQRLDNAIVRAIDFVVERQLTDGRLDLGGNFSPNEVGFPVPTMGKAYGHIEQRAPELFERVKEPLETFFRRAGEALVEGEALSANHRWTAIAAPLAVLHSLFPDERYVAKIDDYLSDGIDCDEDGFWFEERSPNYNSVANQGMLLLADYFGKDELLAHVVRNHELMIAMRHPNGEADASFSFRQDRGLANRPSTIFSEARRVAMHTGDGRFTSMAQEAVNRYGDLYLLFDLIDRPGDMPPAEPLPTEKTWHFPEQHIARVLDTPRSTTLVADPGGHFYDTIFSHFNRSGRSQDWLHLHAGSIVLQSLRLTVGPGVPIEPHALERQSDTQWRLRGSQEGWTHPMQFRRDPKPTTIPRRWAFDATIEFDENTWTLDLDVASQDHLDATLAFYFRTPVTLDGQPLEAGETHFCRGGNLVLAAPSGDKLHLSGLPASQVNRDVSWTSDIPTTLAHCTRLCVGLYVPAKLSLRFEHSVD